MRRSEKKFLSDVILDAENICNLEDDAKEILAAIHRGGRVVFLGCRNMGKTSLIKSKIIPAFLRTHKKSLVVFADLMGVKNLHQIDSRMQKAFEEAMALAHPTKHFIEGLVKTMKNIRPAYTLDPLTGTHEFSLGLSPNERVSFEATIEHSGKYHKNHGALLVLDEFQDISSVEEAEARIRNALQKLPGDLPVILLGSKKHMLAKIFSEPNAPLANWGKPIEISIISPEDYLPYMNERFAHVNRTIEIDEVRLLQNRLRYNPEKINIVCEWITRHPRKGTISYEEVGRAIKGVIDERASFYLEHLAKFTEKEQLFLCHLSQVEPLKQPQSGEFLARIRMSPGGFRPLLQRLEDHAVIYRTEAGYVLSDPLLGEYLKVKG